MQFVGMFVCLGLAFLVAKVVNHMAKRPLLNPWIWFAASYASIYVLGLIVAAIHFAPNFRAAYAAGYYFPMTAVAVGLGIWRAPKWRAAAQAKSNSTSAAGNGPGR